MCGPHHSGDQRGGGPNGQIVSIKRAADGSRWTSQKIIDEERAKYTAKNRSLQNASTDSKATTSVILINHASTPIRKERLSPTSKARREASRNEFMEKGGMPDRVKSFQEIISRKDRLRARLVQERLQMGRIKSMPEQERCFSIKKATLSEPQSSGGGEVGGSGKKLSGGERRAQRRARLLRAQKGSLWVCYAGPLAERQKSGVSGKRHRPKLIPWEKNSWEF